MTQGETVRQQVVKELRESEEPLSVRELSQLVHVSEKDLVSHLFHVERSVRRSGGVLQRFPAACRHCGFEFTKRRDFKRPSRCPVCRSESISPPLLRINSS